MQNISMEIHCGNCDSLNTQISKISFENNSSAHQIFSRIFANIKQYSFLFFDFSKLTTFCEKDCRKKMVNICGELIKRKISLTANFYKKTFFFDLLFPIVYCLIINKLLLIVYCSKKEIINGSSIFIVIYFEEGGGVTIWWF